MQSINPERIVKIRSDKIIASIQIELLEQAFAPVPEKKFQEAYLKV